MAATSMSRRMAMALISAGGADFQLRAEKTMLPDRTGTPPPVVDKSSSTQYLLPPGQYHASQFSFVGNEYSIVAQVAGTVEIVIDDGAYFIDLAGFARRITLDGIRFRGGKGAVRLGRTGQNVASLVEITRCDFLGYSECAIGNNAVDHPYLRIRDCVFECAPDAAAIGVAWGGYVDSGSIESCVFLKNKYHVKLGPRLSGSFHIRANDFILIREFVREADIWLVPNSDARSFGVNSGWGTVIDGNKFGNENQTAGKPRILIADEDMRSGSDRLSRSHSETWSEESFLSGVSFTNQRISSRAGMASPFILSHVAELRSLTWFNNKLDSGRYDYIVQFARPRTATAYNNYWNVILTAGDGVAFPLFGFCNQDIGNINDPDGLLPTYLETVPAGGEAQPPARRAIRHGATQLRAFGAARLAPAPDLFGGGGAMRISAEDTSAGAYLALDRDLAGQKCWARIVMAQQTEGRLPRLAVSVQIADPGRGATLLERRYILDDRVAEITIPFLMPDQPGNWQLKLHPSSGSGLITVLDASVSTGRLPANADHVRTTGSGAWNAPHLILGDFHLWVSAGGALRMAKGAPQHDEDGRAVGS